MSKLIAIHQPNFFPWLGYFEKILKVDLFILLDDVQFPKKQGNWGNRVKINVRGEARWFTMPVVRDYHGFRDFNEMETVSNLPWRETFLQTISMNYARADCFQQEFSFVEQLIQNSSANLATYNTAGIVAVAGRMGIDSSRLVSSSTLHSSGQGTDRLISLILAVGGTAYLCGGGSAGYLEPEKFANAGIKLIYQNFVHPVYPQIGSDVFLPGLSCIDMILNCGFEYLTQSFHKAA